MDGRDSHPSIEYVSIAEATETHPRNDSASIVELSGGELLVVWIEMHASEWKGHDQAPSSIASKRSFDRGRTWTDHRIEVAPDPGDQSVYNPSLIMLPNGELLFFYLKYHHLAWNEPLEATGCIKRSNDGGRTWSDPITIWNHAPYSCANDTFTLLTDGRLIKSCENIPVWGSYPNSISRSGCFISDDNGETWHKSKNFIWLPLRGTMENHIAELKSGDLLMAVRNQLGNVFFSRSTDRGVSWLHPQASGLITSESMSSISRIPESHDLLLIWNNSLYDINYDHSGKRTPLTVAVSTDEGKSWKHIKNIEDDPDYEFSNVACTYISNRDVILTYFTSKMIDPNPPGIFGRNRMSLKGAITTLDWLYA